MADETAELKSQLEILKEAYIKLLNDKDVLINWAKPQLEALYATRIGRFQVERLQMQLRIKAIRRKTELVLGAMNRNQKPDVDVIELEVATELASAERRIMEEVAMIEQSKQMLSNLESPTRSAELRKLYRQFAKVLHPDVNAELTDKQRQLWLLVTEAYRSGDVDTLKAFQLVYESELKQAKEQVDGLSKEELQTKCEVLKEGARLLQEELLEMKNNFPFTIEHQIKDEAWVDEQVKLIFIEIAQLKEYEEELLTEYRRLTALI